MRIKDLRTISYKDQVISLELAQELKKRGIENETFFYWENALYPHKPQGEVNYRLTTSKLYGDWENPDAFSAYNVAELLDMLPPRITLENHEHYKEPYNSFTLHIAKTSAYNIRYIINYYCDTTTMDEDEKLPWYAVKLFLHNIYDENAANALAKTLIKLVQLQFIY